MHACTKCTSLPDFPPYYKYFPNTPSSSCTPCTARLGSDRMASSSPLDVGCSCCTSWACRAHALAAAGCIDAMPMLSASACIFRERERERGRRKEREREKERKSVCVCVRVRVCVDVTEFMQHPHTPARDGALAHPPARKQETRCLAMLACSAARQP